MPLGRRVTEKDKEMDTTLPQNKVEEPVVKPKTTKSNIVFEATTPKYQLQNLIVNPNIKDQIEDIVSIYHCRDIVYKKWGLGSVMKEMKGVCVNLYGAPGTGKTMGAHAIADCIGKKLLCVNYADIESKYVGETSKNLTALFEQAKKLNAVLFFDEADALLSRRVTNMSNSTDVSVNQTRSVLLTLMNDYDELIIFTTNFISNYDPAFMRRISYHIQFELPNEELREKLWNYYVPESMPTNIDSKKLAKDYPEVTGSDISNAVLQAALKAARLRNLYVDHEYFEKAIAQILESKKANSNTAVKNEKVQIEKRVVTEEYAKQQMMRD